MSFIDTDYSTFLPACLRIKIGLIIPRPFFLCNANIKLFIFPICQQSIRGELLLEKKQFVEVNPSICVVQLPERGQV
jgi:hypothetical protein